MNKLLCLILLFTLNVTFYKSIAQIKFDHLYTDDGLSNNSIRGIFQDKNGFLWFGTLNGLNRYDGKKFKIYSYDPEDANSINGNRVSQIYQDKLNYLWVFTYDKLVHRFDIDNEKFYNLPFSIYQQRININVAYLNETSPGVVWFLLDDGGCLRFKSDKNPEIVKWDRFNFQNILEKKDVKFIFNDKKGVIWIGTSKGLFKLPSDTVNFDNPDIEYFFNGQDVRFTTFCENENEIWFGTENRGLIIYDTKDKIFKHSKILDYTANSYIFSIVNGKNKDVLIGTMSDGTIYYPGKNKEIKKFLSGHNGLKSNQVSSIYTDRAGLFWLITDMPGTTMFNPAEEKFHYYPLKSEFRELKDEGEKQIFFEDSNNDFWIGIHGGGLFKYNRNKNEFDHFFFENSNPLSLSSNFVLSIFEDNSNNLWIGTRTSGLNKVNLKKDKYTYIKPVQNSLLTYKNEIKALMEDSNGNIWAGTKGGMLICFDQEMNLLATFSNEPGSYKLNIESGIYTLYADKYGNLWVGTKGKGIYVIKNLINFKGQFRNKKIEVVHFFHNSEDTNSLNSDNVYSIIQDQSHQYWIGTYLGGVDVLTDPFGKPFFRHYMNNNKNNFSLSDDRVRKIVQDKDMNLWIATVNGLNFVPSELLNQPEKKFYQIKNNPDIKNSISYNDILDIYQDKNERIWVGTFGGGLNRLLNYDLNNLRFNWKIFIETEGQPKNIIYSITEDKTGNIWVSTDFGIKKYFSVDSGYENLNAKEIIGLNTFSENGGLRISSNNIIFGYTGGLIVFNPDSIKRNNKEYPLVITNFFLFDEIVKPGMNNKVKFIDGKTKTIILHHNQNFIGFEFAVLDYTAPENIKYAYLLENYEKKWNYSGNQNKAVYRNLKPGKYCFKLKGTNSFGSWGNHMLEYNIKILKPFWKTNFAYSAYFIFAIIILILLFNLINKELKLKHKIELDEKLTDNKLKFYTSISHEFKTPLSLILGPAEKLMSDKSLSNESHESATLIKRNTLRLLELVEQLLDFRKIQKGRLELKVWNFEIKDFLIEICKNFVPLANNKGIDFKFELPESTINGLVDSDCLEKIVFNLLSNAFKYTSSGKSVMLKITTDEKDEILTLTVEDEGKGIPEENLPKIFERFALFTRSGSNGESSSGIGLSLTKELVEIHKGTIEVESEYGKGSKFTVKLPVGRHAYSVDEISEDNDHKFDIGYTIGHMNFIDNNISDKKIKKNSVKSDDVILVIEDNNELRGFIVDNLSHSYRVIEASDGSKGLKSAREDNPDLIICDIMIPVIDGITLCKTIRKDFNTCHIPVIVLTSISSQEQKIKGLETGADDYITKPFSLQYLEKRIENIISQRKILKEKFSQEPGLKPEKLCASPADQKFLSDVINLIEANLSKSDFSIDKVVSELGYGRTVFYKKMKALTGNAPLDFIKIVRMKKASVLLRQTGSSISGVSFELGFNDVDYFSRTFKNFYGETPSEYQKKFR